MEDIFEILPKDWTVDTLSNLCEKPTYGYTASARNDGNARFLRITDIDGYNVNWDSVPFCNIDDKKLKQYRLIVDDIVFARIGATTGKSYIIKNPPENAVYASYLIRVRAKKDYLDSDFLYYYFNSDFYWKQVNANKQSNLKLGVNGSILQQLKIIKPSNIEQRHISHILSTLQRAIAKQEQIIATTQALKKSLLHELFTKGTKGEKLKETEIGLMPESWKMIKMGELGEIITGTTPKTAIPEFYTPAEYDFIAPFDIGKSCKVYDSQKKISAKGLSVIRELPKYSVLCVCIGSTIGKVGLTTKEKSATNQQINSIICDEAKMNPLFVYYLLTFYNRLWAEAATPSPVPILSKGSFSKLEIPFTDDIKEQNNIAKALYVLESKFEFQQRKKSIYESLFKTSLNELMTGNIRVDKISFAELSKLEKV